MVSYKALNTYKKTAITRYITINAIAVTIFYYRNFWQMAEF